MALPQQNKSYTFLDSVKAGIYEDLTIDFRSINI